MKIGFLTLSGKRYTVDVNNESSTIDDLKEAIA
jgi:hypothetical protein